MISVLKVPSSGLMEAFSTTHIGILINQITLMGTSIVYRLLMVDIGMMHDVNLNVPLSARQYKQ